LGITRGFPRAGLGVKLPGSRKREKKSGPRTVNATSHDCTQETLQRVSSQRKREKGGRGEEEQRIGNPLHTTGELPLKKFSPDTNNAPFLGCPPVVGPLSAVIKNKEKSLQRREGGVRKERKKI